MKEQIEEHLRNKLTQQWYHRDTNYILHIGPTNSGKTYNAVQSLKESNKGIYLAPLRLLAWEVYDRLNQEGYWCSLRTGEEKIIIPDAHLTSCTIEMCSPTQQYDCAIVDESFMITDKQRGKFWLTAIMQLNAKTIHIIANTESLPLLKSLLDLTSNTYIVNTYERMVPLVIQEQTINLKKLKPKTVLVTFSRINVLYHKYLLQQYGVKCSILYGNLPPEVKKEQIKNFIEGRTDVLVTTDVIGMGINLPCNTIVFLENSKFDGESVRVLNEKEIKQISGRAGRYGLSEKGTVTAIDPTFILNIQAAFDSNIEETHGVYGLDGEIYTLIPEDTPTKKIKYFETLNYLPLALEKILKKEDVERYYILTKHYDLRQLEDDLAWTFLSCPVNDNNISFWRYAVSSVVHLDKIVFNEKYSLSELENIKQLEEAENSIAVIDLFLYMYGRKLLQPYLKKYDSEFLEKLKIEKDIIIENINRYLLFKKIKAREVAKTHKK